MLRQELLYALLGTGFTCLATVLGAGLVFVFRRDMSANLQRIFLGFAAGVMIAASVCQQFFLCHEGQVGGAAAAEDQYIRLSRRL